MNWNALIPDFNQIMNEATRIEHNYDENPNILEVVELEPEKRLIKN